MNKQIEEILDKYETETYLKEYKKAVEELSNLMTKSNEEGLREVRTCIVRKDGFFNGMKMEIWKALDEYRSNDKVRETLEEIDAGREMFERRILQLLDDPTQKE